MVKKIKFIFINQYLGFLVINPLLIWANKVRINSAIGSELIFLNLNHNTKVKSEYTIEGLSNFFIL